MIDLNRSVPNRSHLTVTDGETINTRGEIAASGMLPNGDFHAVVLIPCNGGQGCQDGSRHEGTRQSTPATGSPTVAGAPLTWTPNEMAAQLIPRSRLPPAGGIGRSPRAGGLGGRRWASGGRRPISRRTSTIAGRRSHWTAAGH